MNDSKSNTDLIEKAYDSEPWWYDLRGLMILTLSYRTTLWDQISFFSKNLRKQHLEAAVGSGSLFAIILRFAGFFGVHPEKIIAFDYAEPMLAGARARFRKDSRVSVRAGDATALSYPDSQFDSINLANAFHCIGQIDHCMDEFFRVLRPGGTFACNVLLLPRGIQPFRKLAGRINDWGMKKGILFRPYEEKEAMRVVRSAGFEIVDSRIRGNSLNILAKRPEN